MFPEHYLTRALVVVAFLVHILVWDRSEARDAQGSTPLRNGCKFLRTSVVSFLVDWGADTNNVRILV